MKLRFLFVLLSLGVVSAIHVNGQTCRTLYKDANSLLEAGKLEKAKAKFQQVINCGDNFYVPDSKKRILWINRILHKPNKKEPFSVSDDQIVIPYQGGQDVVTINGDGAWKAVLDEVAWCRVKKEKGKVYILCEENESNEERRCEIHISMGGKTRTVTVKNEAAPEILVPSVENVTFPSHGGANLIGIHSNTAWKVESAPEWVNTDVEEGTVSLTVLPNENNKERQAGIKIVSTSKSVIINIYQSAGLDHLAFSKNDLHFGPNGGDEYINVYTDAEDWRFGDFPHWCQVTRVADNLIRIHCTPNDPVNLNREASVNVTTGKQTLGINVTQEAKPFVAMIPDFGIGGQPVSFGISAGILVPTIATSCGSEYMGSLVNYALGNQRENASYSTPVGFSVGAHADIRLYKNFYLNAGLNFIHYTYENRFDQTYERRVSTSSMGWYLKGNVHSKYAEDYTMNTLEVPLVFSYRLPLSRISHVQFNLGPVVSIGLNGKMKIDGGYDSEEIYQYSSHNHHIMGDVTSVHFVGRGDMDLYGNRVSYAEANVIGSDDVLLSHDAQLDAAPYRRLNFGARFGVAYEYAGISFGVEYNLMLTNMANRKFWDGDRWMIFGNNAYSVMSGYKQRNNYFAVKLGYTFRYRK